MGDRQPFIWFAKYNDDSILTEFDDEQKENNFNDIDKENLKEFGLLGKGVKIYYSTEDGIIKMKDTKGHIDIIESSLKNGDAVECISSRKDTVYNDIVQFKGFHQDFDPLTKDPLHGVVIDSFHIGYKIVIKGETGVIYVRVLLRLELGSGIKLGFRFAPTFDLKRKLCIKAGSPDPLFGYTEKEVADINVLADKSNVYEVEVK